jgi:hypothetical protein
VKDGREDEPFLRTRHAAIAEVLCGTLEAVVVGSAFGALAQALGRTDQHEILRRLLTAPQSRRPWENTEDVAAIADAIFEAPKGQRLAQTLLPQLSSGPQAERLTSRLLVRHLADGDFDAGAPLSRLLDMAARVGQPSRVLCDALGGLGTRSEATDRLVDAAAAALIEEGEFAGARELIDAEIRRAEVEGRRDLSLRATRLVSELDAQSLNGPHPELENLRVGVEAGLWVSRSAALALVRHLECR